MEIIYFKSGPEFYKWLEENHATASEVPVGFYKKAAAETGIIWAEAVDQALCFGWIDGVRKRVDEDRFTIRFTPRKPRSTWSSVNVNRVGELAELGLMRPAGLKAFNERDTAKVNQYSYEEGDRKLDEASEAKFRANPKAWDFFQAQARSYQKACNWWVISAKKEETRQSRLATLIEHSENGRKLQQFVTPARREKS